MKYIKLFMFAAVMSLFAACSDDENYNGNGEVTLGFENSELTVKENTGYVNVPIKINGLRDGDVKVTISTAEVGNNPAKEDVNYMITTKTLTLKADTLNSGVLNVELKTVDDQTINENRTFSITIESAKGAEITGNKTIQITLRDNDALIYEKFFGKWTLNAKQQVFDDQGYPVPGEYNDFSAEVTISGTTDEENADYDHILTASCPRMFDVGISLDCSWRFRYSFDKGTKQGTLGFICGDLVASYGDQYQWTWATDNGSQITFDDITAPWALGEGDVLPETIVFPENKNLYLYQPGAGLWDQLYEITLTKN